MQAELIKAGLSVAGHQLRRTIGVICTLLVIAGIGWAVYVAFIKPNTKARLETTTQYQTADKIENIEITLPTRKALIDFKLWFVRITLFERNEAIKRDKAKVLDTSATRP